MTFLLMRADQSYRVISLACARRLMRCARVHEVFHNQDMTRAYVVTHLVYRLIAGQAGPVS
jgi:hypothetical protein